MLSLLSFVINTNGLARVDPLVDTNVGLIRGLQATDGDYSMFLGIPYANVNHTNPFGVSFVVKSSKYLIKYKFIFLYKLKFAFSAINPT